MMNKARKTSAKDEANKPAANAADAKAVAKKDNATDKPKKEKN